MTVEPLFDNLLVAVDDRKETTESGFVIPDNASHDRPQKGTVKSKGPEASVVNVGDIVVFKKYSPDDFEIEGEKFWILSQKDVIAIIR